MLPHADIGVVKLNVFSDQCDAVTSWKADVLDCLPSLSSPSDPVWTVEMETFTNHLCKILVPLPEELHINTQHPGFEERDFAEGYKTGKSCL